MTNSTGVTTRPGDFQALAEDYVLKFCENDFRLASFSQKRIMFLSSNEADKAQRLQERCRKLGLHNANTGCNFRWHLVLYRNINLLFIICHLYFTLLCIISGFLMQLPTFRWFAGELRFTGIETRAKCIHKQCLLPSRHNTERHSTSHKIDLDPSERLELP
ncbi:hypothetical protein ALC53_08414 [Atta colombica]|uniref:Uncharacterized protein n=1 Tax=Atta colombica TaxID=520822 RepID=A0A195B956_9HYME|nr:hypothetical protein ALC53_08414 [Atta colombica]